MAQTLRWQRALVILAVAGAAVIVITHDSDVFSMPKFTWIVLCAIAGVAIGGARAARERRIVLPATPSAIAAAAFLVALVITTLTSTTPMQSVVGQPQQNAGLLLYASCVALFLIVLRSFTDRTLESLLLSVVVVAVIVSGYGFLQWRGIDPVDWSVPNSVFATMGNPNFLAGWLGAVFPLCVAVALARTLVTPWRVLGAVGGVLTLVAAFLTKSFQGPVSIGVGIVAFGLLFVLTGGVTLPPALRGRRGALALLSAVVVAVPVGVVVAGDGIDDGLVEREYFWQVAVEVFTDNPIVGTGPDTFQNQYLVRRPIEHAANPLAKNAGAAHDVPLDMFAGGGLLLGLSYLAFMGLVGWQLVRAVRRRSAPAWMVAGVGAAWIAYLTQSLVSLDKPHLAVLHWVLAGAVVVLAGEIPVRAIALPGRPAGRGHAPTSTVVATGAIVVVALVAAWFASQPFRADLAHGAGKDALQHGNVEKARSRLADARRLAPWEASYTFTQVLLANQVGDQAAAIEAAEDGARLEPGDSSYLLVAGEVNDAYGHPERAREWFDKALAIDPYGIEPLDVAARSAAKNSDPERARRLLDRMLEVSRDRYDVWETVAAVAGTFGDREAAREAYEEMLRLRPGDDAATKGLESLDP